MWEVALTFKSIFFKYYLDFCFIDCNENKIFASLIVMKTIVDNHVILNNSVNEVQHLNLDLSMII